MSVQENQNEQNNNQEGNQTAENDKSNNSSSAVPKNDRFYQVWDRFAQKPPPPRKSILPSLDLDIEEGPGHRPRRNTQGVISNENAVVSFEEAAATCKSKVAAIVNECKRINLKYYDPTFKLGTYDTLASLAPGDVPDSWDDTVGVGSDIFDNPSFIKDGATANDIRQGRVGDCWFLAAVTALSGTEEPDHDLKLLTNLCIARDEQVGVYGFVFYRDGEWVSEVIDDRLCQRHAVENQKQYICRIPAEKDLGSIELKPSNFEPLAKQVKENLSKGSDTLYFSSCRDSDETWLPLLEKAYAKAHGDYQAIEAGIVGEGIEDLTGGVNTCMDSENILDKDRLWAELLRVNQDFLFGCGSRRGKDEEPADDEGFVRGHAYTVLEAKEYGKERLLKIRNPWGRQEWNGAWSDGSREWTSQALAELNHTFGDDGIFWISFKDFLRYYPIIDRTRLFGPEWTVTQQWTSINVPQHPTYLDTRFQLHIHKTGPIVIVLSQPDDRYFQGLEGRYRFSLHFRLYKDGERTYLLRSMTDSGLGRSCSAELEVEPGSYTVLMKITASRVDDYQTPEELIQKGQRFRRAKLLDIGKSYDMTHSKGLLREKENENARAMKQRNKSKTMGKEIKHLRAQRAKNLEAKRKEKLRRQRIQDGMKERNQAKITARKLAREMSTAENEAIAGQQEENEAKENGDESKRKDEDTDAKSDKGSRVVPENGLSGGHQLENGDYVGNNEPEDDAVSRASELDDDDFDWESDIDNPISPVELSDDEDDFEDNLGNDLWNAVCVVGLRVHSMDANVQIAVIEKSTGIEDEVA